MDIRFVILFFSILYLVSICVFGLPVSQTEEIKTKEETKEDEKKIETEIDDLGLEYGRYLQQVVEALEQDKEFAKKLENVSQEEIKNGAIAQELDFVNHNIRNKLDELKRIEMDRLRLLAKKERQLENGENIDDGSRRWRSLGADSSALTLDAQHLDHLNPHSFEAQDLQKLILSATKDLEVLDSKRKEDFKSYEMEKELLYREALVNMTSEEREKTIEKHDKMQEQHKQHPKVHHPGSKKQLEQVWEEQDHMPREEFNPKIFFTMHDINGDGFLDPEEVEAILSVEIKKMYSDKNPEDDRNEMQEEYHRMREHIYKEADINRDGLISKKEFLEFTHRMEFEKDDGWKGLDETQVYSEQELKQFQEQQRQQYEQRQQYAAYQQFDPQYYPEGYHPPQQQHQQQQQYHPQQHQQQQQQYPHQQQQQHHQQQPQHYIPPPNQMSAEQWAQQQQYYNGIHPNQGLQQPNPQLHPQQHQQQQFHQQQQQQQQQQQVPQINQQQFQQQQQQQPVQQQPQQHQQINKEEHQKAIPNLQPISSQKPIQNQINPKSQ